jgi:hypothetical protein
MTDASQSATFITPRDEQLPGPFEGCEIYLASGDVLRLVLNLQATAQSLTDARWGYAGLSFGAYEVKAFLASAPPPICLQGFTHEQQRNVPRGGSGFDGHGNHRGCGRCPARIGGCCEQAGIATTGGATSTTQAGLATTANQQAQNALEQAQALANGTGVVAIIDSKGNVALGNGAVGPNDVAGNADGNAVNLGTGRASASRRPIRASPSPSVCHAASAIEAMPRLAWSMDRRAGRVRFRDPAGHPRRAGSVRPTSPWPAMAPAPPARSPSPRSRPRAIRWC